MNRTQRIIDLHHQGFGAASIATQLGISPHVAEEVLREAGLGLAGVVANDSAQAGVALATVAVHVPPPKPKGQRPPLTALALAAGGFHRIGAWVAGPGGALEMDGAAPARPGLYAFVADGEAKYLGATLRRLDARLNLYRSGQGAQAGQVRLRAKLLEALSGQGAVEIHTVTPPDGVWSGWPVSTAAGLETAMLKRFELPWNRKGG